MEASLEELVRQIRMKHQLPTAAARRVIRESVGISQVALGKAIGVSGAAICRWETGSRQPHGELLRKYVAALQVLAGGAP